MRFLAVFGGKPAHPEEPTWRRLSCASSRATWDSTHHPRQSLRVRRLARGNRVPRARSREYGVRFCGWPPSDCGTSWLLRLWVPRQSRLATWCAALCEWHGKVVPRFLVEPEDMGVAAILKAQHPLVHAGRGPAEAVAATGLPELGALRHAARDTRWTMELLAVAVTSPGILLREIEAACARAEHLTINRGSKRATLFVPVSNADPMAIGCPLAQGCTCLGREIGADRT